MGAGDEVKTLYSNAASSGIGHAGTSSGMGTVAIPEEHPVKSTLQTKSSAG